MGTKISIAILLVVIASFSLSHVMAQEDFLQLVDIGNSALWVEIVGDKVYATNPEDGTIVVIDAASNEIVDTITTVKGISVIEVVEEKNKIYATAAEKAPVYVYDLTTGESLGEIDIGEPQITLFSKSDQPYGQREYITFDTDSIGLAYDSTTELLYAVHSTVNHVNIIDTNTDKDLGHIAVGKRPLMIELDEQRGIGYVTNWETNNVSVLDLEARTEIKSLNTGFVPDQMEMDPENNRLYVTHHESQYVSVIDLRTQEIETKVQMGGTTHAIAFDKKNGLMHVTYLPESSVTGTIDAEDKVQFIDTSTNKIVGRFNINVNPFTIDIDSENQKLFATYIKDGVVVAVDLTSHPEY